MKNTNSRPGARKIIRVITGRDNTAIEAIAKVGVAMKSQLMDYCGLTNERLNKLVHSGYLKSLSEYVTKLSIITVYELDKKGERGRKPEGVPLIVWVNKHSCSKLGL